MIKRIYLATFIFLIIVMPVCSFAADDELDWVMLSKARLKKEEIDKFSGKGDTIIPMLREAYKSENVIQKANVLRIFGNMPGENSKKEMIGILEALCVQPLSGRRWDGLPEEVYLEDVALSSIEKSGGEALVVLKRNLNSAKGEIRKCLIVGMGFLGDSSYYDTIVQILETDENPYLRRYSAIALSKIGNEKTMPILEKVIRNDDFYYSLNKTEAQNLFFITKDGKYYPVKEAATLALFVLGKTLEQRGIISPKGVELPSPSIANKPYYTPPPGLTNKPDTPTTPPWSEMKW